MHRIALESTCLTTPHPTGIARYATKLITSLRNRPEYETRPAFRGSRYLRGKKNIPQIEGVKHLIWSKNLPLQGSRGIHLVHGLDHVLPEWPRAKKVSTVHDMYAHLSIDHGSTQASNRRLAQYQKLVEQSDHIICVSESTKRDLLSFYSYPDDKVSVVHHGVDAHFSSIESELDEAILAKLGIQRPFLLYLGALKSSKNVDRLITAFDEQLLAHDFDLIIAGDGSEKVNLEQHAAGTRDPTAIKFLGFAREQHIPTLYRKSAGFCLVSLYEGFGIPIIEALKSGTPVLTANAGGAADIANKHGLLCDPYNIASIGEGLISLANQNGSCSPDAKAYSEQFTWAEAARQTAEVYAKVLR